MKGLRNGTVLAALCILLSCFLTACQTAEDGPGIWGTDNRFTRSYTEAFPQYRLKETAAVPKCNPFYLAQQGHVVPCLDVQAIPAIRAGLDLSFRPQGCLTVVLAVDRGQTDAVIHGWQDLARENLPVSFPDKELFQRIALAAIACGLDGAAYTQQSAITYLKGLQEKGLLHFDDSSCPVTVCLDTQALYMAETGRQLDIVVPCEGTLRYTMGLLSKEPAPALSDEALLQIGLRLPDGQSPSPLFPDAAAYAAAVPVTDYARFTAVTEDTVRTIRRQVQHTRLFSSADGREHTVSFILVSVCLLVWCAYALYRSYRQDVRRWMGAVTALSIGWMLISLIKYQLQNHFLARLCWYAYYIPLLGLPLITLYMALMIDKPSGLTKPPRWLYPYAALCPLLLLLVFTNDWHRLVFRFRPDSGWNDRYSYGPGYYAVFAYCLITFLWATALMIAKTRKSPRRFAFLLPSGAAALMIFYNIGYVLGVPLARDSNYSLVFCLGVLLFAESALRAGFIPVNSHYQTLFAAAPLQMQLLNQQGETVIAANSPLPLSHQERQAVTDKPGIPLQKDKDTLLHSYPIPGGIAVWQEDISRLNRLHDDIAASVEKLRAANALLQKENTVLREKASVEIKAQLLCRLEEDLGEKNDLLRQAIEELTPSESGWEQQVGYITLLLCYIKRRSNLFFLSQQGDTVSGVELTVYLDELSEFAAFSGVHALVRCEDIKHLPVKTAALYYDGYFTMLSWAAKDSRATLIGRLDETSTALSFSVLSSVKTDTLRFTDSFYRAAQAAAITVERRCTEDSDGIYLTANLQGGMLCE